MANDEANRTKFVVGLGNPGREYQGTRHNVGFDVLASLRRRWRLGEGRRAFRGRFYTGRAERPGDEARQVMLLGPRTYMNRSGLAVAQMASFYKADHEDILVVLDDMALPLGQLRARAAGSAGGHNGLAGVLDALGSRDVPRLRLGIGQPGDGWDGADFVLSRFRPDEMETIGQAVQLAGEAVEDWVFRGIGLVMDKYNRKADG